MIILIVEYEEESNKFTVSHGVDSETFQNVVMQQLPLDYYIRTCNAIFLDYMNSWVLI